MILWSYLFGVDWIKIVDIPYGLALVCRTKFWLCSKCPAYEFELNTYFDFLKVLL